jgi:lysophospholipase L1-like esterase
MKPRSVLYVLSILSNSLVFALVTLLVANAFATIWLRARPELLMSSEDRINENTRAVREKMITPDQAVLWYDLGSPDEVKPMWDEFYRAGAQFESYVHFRSRPLQGKYYGVTEQGYRLVRDNGPWPPSRDNFNVFFFGGSTSFGVGPYWATVASYLQKSMNASGEIGRPVRVYNFGRSGYISTQEEVLFHRLISAGHRPDMVVFMDGLNDFCFNDGQPSSWQTLATFFNDTNGRYQREAAGYGIATKWGSLTEFVRTLALMRLTRAGMERLFAAPVPKYVAPTEQVRETAEPEATLRAVMARYVGNMRQVKAVAESMGIVPVFVWQPIPTYNYDLRYHVFNPDRLGCHVNSKVGYPLMRASEVAKPLGRSFVWAADIQKELAEPLYVDAFHYTAPMSRRIAEFIHSAVRDRDLIKAAKK